MSESKQKFLIVEHEGRIFQETETPMQFCYYRKDGNVLTEEDQEALTDFYLRYAMYQMEHGNMEKAPICAQMQSKLLSEGKSMLLIVSDVAFKVTQKSDGEVKIEIDCEDGNDEPAGKIQIEISAKKSWWSKIKEFFRKG